MSYFLVDEIIPAHEVSLVGGPSGAGKTRWLMHQLLQWELGEDFLGYRSHPAPWIYIAADRSLESVRRTLTGMAIDPKHIQIVPAWDKHMSENAILDAIKDSGAKLAVWESFGSYVDPPAQGHQVKKFLNRMGNIAKADDFTILGVVESPKMKPYEKYENPRQRISGCAGWAHFSETIFLIEADQVDDPHNPDRSLYLCPRNVAGRRIALTFDTLGRLLPRQEEDVVAVVSKMRNRSKSPLTH